MKNYKFINLLIAIGFMIWIVTVIFGSIFNNDTNYYNHLSKCKTYNKTKIDLELAPLFPVPNEFYSYQRQIIKLKNGDCSLKNKTKSFMHNYSTINEYYIPEDYAKDFGKLMLNFDKYPSERVKLKKDFCKKHLIHCDSEPTIENIFDDMSSFYKVSDRKKYKMISKAERDEDIEECKYLMNKLMQLSIKESQYWQMPPYYQHELISKVKSSSKDSPLGTKEYKYFLDQNKDNEWIIEYRTNFSICKAYAYPNGVGTYKYRPVILDPNNKWRGWLGSQIIE